MKLNEIIDEYMKKVPGIKEHCDRCLNTERWRGSVVLMIVDASFTSLGLNYFTAVVPKVEEFRKKFVESGKITSLRELKEIDIEEVRKIWKNRRSWKVAREIANHLAGKDDRKALREWAKNASLDNWKKDPIGRINGVGINTFQYLRMMGGIDTVMPDKIVKRVINEIFEKAGYEAIHDDIEFIRRVEEIAHRYGYRAIELCWMTWFIQPEGKKLRIEKYADILPLI